MTYASPISPVAKSIYLIDSDGYYSAQNLEDLAKETYEALTTNNPSWAISIGSLDVNAGGITNAGAISGATDISLSGELQFAAATFHSDGSYLHIHPTIGNNVGQLCIMPSGTEDEAHLRLRNSISANWGAVFLRIDGVIASISSDQNGTGTAPTTLNINDADWDAINIGDASCAVGLSSVSITGGAVSGVTTLSMNNQLTNSLAIGTPPFVITSTDVVANLNVDMVDGYHLDQGVLIASTPTFAGLTVNGAMTLNGAITGVNSIACDLGTSINEFSTDGTLVGNSDDALPSEQAVKTYVDAAVVGASLYAFKTITGITNDVVADQIADALTLASANNLLTIVGVSATDTITWTIVEGNFILDGNTVQIDGVNSDGGAFPFTTSGDVTFSNDVLLGSGTNSGTALTIAGTSNGKIEFRDGTGASTKYVAHIKVTGDSDGAGDRAVVTYDAYADHDTNAAATTPIVTFRASNAGAVFSTKDLLFEWRNWTTDLMRLDKDGDLWILGDLTAANIVTAGLVDGVDVAALKTDVDGFNDELKDLTQVEIQQLELIDAVTISNAQWGYLGALDQTLIQASSPTFVGLTLSGAITGLTDLTMTGAIATPTNISMTGELDLTGVNACIDLNPAGTGSKNIIDMTPSAALVAGSSWKGLRINSAALDPATGATSYVYGIEIENRFVESVDKNAYIHGVVVRSAPGDTGYSFVDYVTEKTQNKTHSAFYSYFGGVLSATATYRGVHIDWGSITRDGGAPVLEGLRIGLPADYTDFGFSSAGQFTGDGRTVIICDTSYALNVSGAMLLNGNVSGINTITLDIGTNITEFSTDGTLAGDSDDALPTEQAVKTYVDAQIAAVNSLAEVLALGNEADGTNLLLDEGADLIVYSDDKVSEVARIAGATGNITTIGTVDGVDVSAIVAFKTITGITNDVVADSLTDSLTLATANNLLTIVGTTATDTITFTIVEANISHDAIADVSVDDHHAQSHALTTHSDVVLADPGADQIVFWDDSDSKFEFLVANTGLSIVGNNLNCDITQYTDGLARTACLEDDVYGVGWDADVTHAPTQNALYDKIAAMDILIAANTTVVEVEAVITAEIVGGQSIDNAIDALINTHNVANRHIDHSGVTITAGVGLSGGGTIAASRTIDCDITQYTDGLARTACLEDDVYGAGWDADVTHAPTQNAVYDKINAMDTLIAANTTVAEVEGIITAELVNGQSIDLAIDALINTHNAADNHVAHSGVTITAGVGLSGGGTIAASRTIDCDITQYVDADAQAACVSDAVYGAGWDAVVDVAPSKNAVYDQLVTHYANVDAHHAQVHTHDGDTLQLDGINSNGGAFSFLTTGPITFNNALDGITTISAGGTYFQVDASGNVMLSVINAGAGDPFRDSPTIELKAKYWTGAATADVAMLIGTDATGGAPNYDFFIKREDLTKIFSVDESGNGMVLGDFTVANLITAGSVDGVDISSIVAFKTITGITNNVVADGLTDTLTLSSANALLTIVGTTATDTIQWTVVEANFVLDGNTLQIDGINSDGGAFAFTTSGLVQFNNALAGIADLSMSGQLDMTGADVWIDLNPAATGTQDIIQITPSAALAAGVIWTGISQSLGGLDPAAGGVTIIRGFEIVANFLESDDGNLRFDAIVTNACPADDTNMFRANITELTADKIQIGFLCDGGSKNLSATGTYQGLHIDWDGITRDGGAPVLQGVRVQLPADYTDFGVSYAGYFSGDGRTATICNTDEGLLLQATGGLVQFAIQDNIAGVKWRFTESAGTLTIDPISGTTRTVAFSNSGAGDVNVTMDGDLTVSGGTLKTIGTTPLVLYRNSSAITGGVYQNFQLNDIASTLRTYGILSVHIEDNTVGSIDGYMSFSVASANAVTERMKLDSLGNLQIDGNLLANGTEIRLDSGAAAPHIIKVDTGVTLWQLIFDNSPDQFGIYDGATYLMTFVQGGPVQIPGELDMTGALAHIDLNPAGTGTKSIIHLNPTANLVAGSTWRGFDMELGALDPATGAACSVHGMRINAASLVSVDHDLPFYGFLCYGTPADNSIGFYYSPGEMTQNKATTGFYSYLSGAKSATATYRGLYLNWGATTRDAGAPVLHGVEITLPASFTDFGACYAAYFAGGGQTVTLCNGSWGIYTVGNAYFSGTLTCGGDLQVSGNDIKDSSGGVVLSFDANGRIDSIGPMVCDFDPAVVHKLYDMGIAALAWDECYADNWNNVSSWKTFADPLAALRTVGPIEDDEYAVDHSKIDDWLRSRIKAKAKNEKGFLKWEGGYVLKPEKAKAKARKVFVERLGKKVPVGNYADGYSDEDFEHEDAYSINKTQIVLIQAIKQLEQRVKDLEAGS